MGIFNDFFRQYFPNIRVKKIEYDEPFDRETVNSRINEVNDNLNSFNREIFKLSQNNPAWLLEYFKNNSDPTYFRKITIDSVQAMRFNDQYFSSTPVPNINAKPFMDAFFNDATPAGAVGGNDHGGANYFIVPCNDLKYENADDLIVLLFHSEKGCISNSEYFPSGTLNGMNIFVSVKNTLDPSKDNFTANIPHTFYVMVLKRRKDTFQPKTFRVVLPETKAATVILPDLANSYYVVTRQLNDNHIRYAEIDSNLKCTVTANNKNETIVVITDKTGADLPRDCCWEVVSSFDKIDYDFTILYSNTRWSFVYKSAVTTFVESDFNSLNLYNNRKVLKIPLFYSDKAGIRHTYGYNSAEEFMVFINGVKMNSKTDFKIKSDNNDNSYIELTGYFDWSANPNVNIKVSKTTAFTEITQHTVLRNFTDYKMSEGFKLSTDLITYETSYAFSNGKIFDMQLDSVFAKIGYAPSLTYNDLDITTNLLCTETNKQFLIDLDKYLNPVDYTLTLLNIDGKSYKANIIQNYIDAHKIQPIKLKPVDYDAEYTRVTEAPFGQILRDATQLDRFYVDPKFVKDGEYYHWFSERGCIISVTDQGHSTAFIRIVKDTDFNKAVIRCKRYDINGITTLSTNTVDATVIMSTDGNPIIDVTEMELERKDDFEYIYDLPSTTTNFQIDLSKVKINYNGKLVEVPISNYIVQWDSSDSNVVMPKALDTYIYNVDFSRVKPRPNRVSIDLHIMNKELYHNLKSRGAGNYQTFLDIDNESISKYSTYMRISFTLN